MHISCYGGGRPARMFSGVQSNRRPSVCRLHVGKNDVLTFYDGDDLTAKVLGQYAGSRPRFKLYTSMADVIIQFQSDPATNVFGYHNGFVIHFFGMVYRGNGERAGVKLSLNCRTSPTGPLLAGLCVELSKVLIKTEAFLITLLSQG